MKIKAVIFDLDDTLYDGSQLRVLAIEQSVKAMIERGLNCSIEEGVRKMKELMTSSSLNKFKEFIEYFGPYSDELWEYGRDGYINAYFDKLIAYPDVLETLERLKDKKLVLITEGTYKQQNKKIDILGVRNYFEHIFIPEIGKKESYFLRALDILDIDPEEILVIGDRVDREIKIGNKLGMKTVRLMRGLHSFVNPEDDLERADFEIKDFNEVFDIIEEMDNVNTKQDGVIEVVSSDSQVEQERVDNSGLRINNKNINKNQLKIVAIGGGTGLPTIVEGLREHTDNLTMIVTVTDSGRSSGVLRRELDVLPPGDIRNCLISLSNSEKLMCDLFQYRFENGSLEGHNFGNLFIAALTKLTGSFEKGVEEASRILKLGGKVLPSTLDNINICAELEDGNIIEEEDNIIDRHNKYVHLRPGIKRVFLKPSARANKKALEEIKKADLIVLCPGSLFTSMVTNLLVEGIADAICKSKAKKVYVCNIMTQVSQTHGYKASDHVRQVINYLGGNLDYVILNSGKPNSELLESYRKENAFLVENDISEIEGLGIKVIVDELLDKSAEKKMLWEKKDLLRHEPLKVARVLIGLVD